MPILPQSWSGYLMGALVGLCLWIVRQFKTDLKELQTASGNFMTRADVVVLVAAAEARQLEQHRENMDNFRELRLQNETMKDQLFKLALQKQP